MDHKITRKVCFLKKLSEISGESKKDFLSALKNINSFPFIIFIVLQAK